MPNITEYHISDDEFNKTLLRKCRFTHSDYENFKHTKSLDDENFFDLFTVYGKLTSDEDFDNIEANIWYIGRYTVIHGFPGDQFIGIVIKDGREITSFGEFKSNLPNSNPFVENFISWFERITNEQDYSMFQ